MSNFGFSRVDNTFLGDKVFNNLTQEQKSEIWKIGQIHQLNVNASLGGTNLVPNLSFAMDAQTYATATAGVNPGFSYITNGGGPNMSVVVGPDTAATAASLIEALQLTPALPSSQLTVFSVDGTGVGDAVVIGNGGNTTFDHISFNGNFAALLLPNSEAPNTSHFVTATATNFTPGAEVIAFTVV
jgi:hypothetical protein